MSQLNLKFVAAVLIFCFSLTELIVFNEEVFLFVCFFIFFNAVSTFGGESIKQSFQEIGEDIEKTFLAASKKAKFGISELIIKKSLANDSIDRVLVFLKAFKIIILQRTILSVWKAHSGEVKFCTSILKLFEAAVLEARNSSSVSVDQIFAINAKTLLKSTSSTSSDSRVFFASPKPKNASRLADRLLSQGLLTKVNKSL